MKLPDKGLKEMVLGFFFDLHILIGLDDFHHTVLKGLERFAQGRLAEGNGKVGMPNGKEQPCQFPVGVVYKPDKLRDLDGQHHK